MYVAFVSYGNDSIALLQWLHDKGIKDVVAAHSDTGWAADYWAGRVEDAEEWTRDVLGYKTYRIASEGFRQLTKRKHGFPFQGQRWCTQYLKIVPAQKFLAEFDPEKEATCIVGVRREESRARAQWPEWTEESEKHEGRSLWAPLVNHTKAMRDELIVKTGFEVLPHRSQECFPCINANREDLRHLTEERVAEIEKMEAELGHTMFRPYRHQGATGIRQVWEWAKAERGQYKKNLVVLGEGSGCDSGMCGES